MCILYTIISLSAAAVSALSVCVLVSRKTKLYNKTIITPQTHNNKYSTLLYSIYKNKKDAKTKKVSRKAKKERKQSRKIKNKNR